MIIFNIGCYAFLFLDYFKVCKVYKGSNITKNLTYHNVKELELIKHYRDNYFYFFSLINELRRNKLEAFLQTLITVVLSLRRLWYFQREHMNCR